MDAVDIESQQAPAKQRPHVVLRVARAALALLFLLGALAIACYFGAIEDTALGKARPAAPLPPQVDANLRCEPGFPMQVELLPEIQIDGHRVLPGRMHVKRPGGEAHEARFWFYFADGVVGKAPTVIVTPILASPTNEIAKLLANDMAKNGMHAVIVDRTWKVGEVAFPDFEGVETNLSDMVADRRRVIDWLETRPEVDSARLGAYGVSLGGLVTVCLAAAEPRLNGSVAVMAGGDLGAVICRSVEGECVDLARSSGVPEGASPEQLADFEERARAVITTDPYVMAPYVDPAKILLIATRRDTSVPSFLQERLREALGNPQTTSLPTGHYSAIFYLPVITSRAREFLQRRLR